MFCHDAIPVSISLFKCFGVNTKATDGKGLPKVLVGIEIDKDLELSQIQLVIPVYISRLEIGLNL